MTKQQDSNPNLTRAERRALVADRLSERLARKAARRERYARQYARRGAQS